MYEHGTTMKLLKQLREDLRAFNFDTDEELDLDSLADIDFESLLGDGYLDADTSTEVDELDFDNDLLDTPLDGFDDDLDFDLNSVGSDEFADDLGFEEDEFSVGDDLEDADLDFDLNSIGSDEFPEDVGAESFETDDQMDAEDFTNDLEAEEEHPDFQGEIRTVRGANLVYKRKTDEGNFEELWIYNVGNDIKRETQIRRAVLAGTDIDPSAQESADGSQRSETTTTGNVQFLHITGLPQ